MSKGTMAPACGAALLIQFFLLACLICAAPACAEPGEPAQKTAGPAPSPGGLPIPGGPSDAQSAAPPQPRAQDSLNYAPGYNGFAGTWRDPENGDIVTSVIAPRPQPAPQDQTPMIIEPQISPGYGGNGQGWSGGQPGGVYYVGPGKAFEVPSSPAIRPWAPGWNTAPGSGWTPAPPYGSAPSWPSRPGSPAGGWGGNGAPAGPVPPPPVTPPPPNGVMPPAFGNGQGAGSGQAAPGWHGPAQPRPNRPASQPGGSWGGNGSLNGPASPPPPNGVMPPALGNGQGTRPGAAAPGWTAPVRNWANRPWGRPLRGLPGNGGWRHGPSGHFPRGAWRMPHGYGPHAAWSGR